MNGTEIKLINEAIESNWIAPSGPKIESFEKKICKYLNVKYSVALSSGTAALHLALKVLNVNPNDYVFCSDLTFIASANAIRYVNANPVFIDSDLDSWNMCSEALVQAFREFSPKAVIVTNIFGQSANYKKIAEICKNFETPIIEDSAESLGADYYGKKSGSFGDLSILSFNGNKIITTSGGGMLLSNNKAYIDKARKLSTQSREKKIYYEHKEIGYNYRMSNILASIGIGQLATLDKMVDKRRKIFKIYKEELINENDIEFMPEIENGRSSNWLSVILLKKIKFKKILNLISFLSEKNIEARPVWKPMHMQPIFKNYKFIFSKNEPVSKYLYHHGLCLPSGSSLKVNQQKKNY